MLKRVLVGQVESQSDEDTNTETEFIIEPAPEEVSSTPDFSSQL